MLEQDQDKGGSGDVADLAGAERDAGPLLPLSADLAGGHELDAGCGSTACRAQRSHHHRLRHAGLDLGLVFAFPGQGVRVLILIWRTWLRRKLAPDQLLQDERSLTGTPFYLALAHEQFDGVSNRVPRDAVRAPEELCVLILKLLFRGQLSARP